jgi:hypothetical protein
LRGADRFFAFFYNFSANLFATSKKKVNFALYMGALCSYAALNKGRKKFI